MKGRARRELRRRDAAGEEKQKWGRERGIQKEEGQEQEQRRGN